MFVKEECVKLHRKVNFCEEGVTFALFEDIVYPRQGIDLELYHSVQGAKVANPLHSPILFRYKECG